jgi:integrase
MPRGKRLVVRTIRRRGRTQYVADLRAFGGSRLFFDSIVDAQEALREADLREIQQPSPRRNGARETTVAMVAARFLHASQKKAGQTYRRYRSDLEAHILPRFGDWRWQQLDRQSAIDFLNELKETEIVCRRRGIDGRSVLVPVPGKRRSDATIRGVLATLSALASYAVDNMHLADHNPFLRLAKPLQLNVTKASRRAHAKKKTLTAVQVERLLARAAAEPGSWLLPLLLCVLRVGLRIGEALALQPEDLDLSTPDRETLSVTRARTVDRHGAVVIEAPKTEAGVRTLRLSAPVVGELRRWLEVGRLEWKLKAGWRTLPPWLFFADVDPGTYPAEAVAAGLLDPGNVRRALRRLTRALHAEDVAAGVRPGDQFPEGWTPHGGRHTVATHLIQAGAHPDRVRQLLGHESIRTTADVYGRGNDPAATAGLLEALDALAPVPTRPPPETSRRSRRRHPAGT